MNLAWSNNANGLAEKVKLSNNKILASLGVEQEYFQGFARNTEQGNILGKSIALLNLVI